ncbi:Zinc finger protein 271-like 2 [Homarus americanus]|uniref:Zinc finger protein 271-like 2 n=1 Tax=Homarus americanus TaxID=6706 RepID=A0A8J5JCH2_HOMAM|nr:Zinc finger protein 271-like 2 [Homarus americanus]
MGESGRSRPAELTSRPHDALVLQSKVTSSDNQPDPALRPQGGALTPQDIVPHLHRCQFCTYSSPSRGDLKKHVRIHTGEKPYACPHCSYRCSDSSALSKHCVRGAVSGVGVSWDGVSRTCHHGCIVDNCRACKPFTCHHCPYATRSRADLVKHVRKHTGERPFPCPLCSYRASDRSTLRKHFLRHNTWYTIVTQAEETAGSIYRCAKHMCRQWLEQLGRVGALTGKAKVTCPLCGKVCSRSDKLKLHLRTHTGERPYLCSYCDHRSRTSDDLKRHVRTHTGERPYQCPFCPYRASDPSTIRSHKKHRHHELFYQARLDQQQLDQANA